MKEVCRLIKDFPKYEISNFGNVYSLYCRQGLRKEKRLVKPQLDGIKYYRVRLYNENGTKRKLIHRLVLEAFVPNILNKEQVNHIDSDRLNNVSRSLISLIVNNKRWKEGTLCGL